MLVLANSVILLVEDDAHLRKMVANLLKSENLGIIECTTAESAEVTLGAVGSELLALVTDVNLDGKMTGLELAAIARSRYPKLRIVVMSGSAQHRLPENTLFLSKPYSKSELLKAVLN